MTRVVNIKHESYDVYIGRPSIFGNPFVIGQHGDRSQVIAEYEFYAWTRVKRDADFRKAVKDLKGKTLGCFCRPEACHGDILADIAEWINFELIDGG